MPNLCSIACSELCALLHGEEIELAVGGFGSSVFIRRLFYDHSLYFSFLTFDLLSLFVSVRVVAHSAQAHIHFHFPLGSDRDAVASKLVSRKNIA